MSDTIKVEDPRNEKRILKILKTRIDAFFLLRDYYLEDADGMHDRMELLMRCNNYYYCILDMNDSRLRNYEIEDRLDSVRPTIFHMIDELCPFNGFKFTDEDGTFKGYRNGDIISEKTRYE